MRHIIDTFEEFLDIIFKAQQKIEAYNCDSDNYIHKGIALRGQSNSNFQLIPSIGRDRKFSCDFSILNQERNLIEMAKYKLPSIFDSNLSPIDLLALLQHYGVPTRLLDVTSNPLVALYFATFNDEVDGEAFLFEYNDSDKTNYPITNAIAESYKYSFSTMKPLISFFEDIVSQSYFDEQRNMFCYDTYKQKEAWIKECCESLLFVNATEQLERQKLQQGFYILFPNKISEYKNNLYFEKIIEPISKSNKQIIERIIIRKVAKAGIRKKLEFLGISEATLFADNIDVVCNNIVEKCKKHKTKIEI